MYKKIRQKIATNLVNIPGWKTDRKIVVIESDDWGSIRMPSKEAYNKLLAKDIRVDRSIYNTFDVLEQRQDLELLFNALVNFKDMSGNHAVFTFNTVMGNPAFDLIEEDQFKKYHHEDFEVSYKKYNGDNIFDLWQYAIEEKLICPQFHAKEHLNVSLWMEALQKKHHETRVAFEHNFFGLKTNTPSPNQGNYLAAYWVENEDDFERKSTVLEEGFKMFKMKFGIPSASFVACNYIFAVEMEEILGDLGVKYIQTQRGHISPDIFTGNKKVKRHFTGEINDFDQLYLVRNCFFEPTLEQNIDSVDSCLKQIETAFRWKKPAIISTHRVNYVGGLIPGNRNKNLDKLEKLITQVLNNWPEVEFMSTTELGTVMENNI